MDMTAHAKINLMLHITGRRDDGYHLMQSFMAFADFGDRITVHETGEYALSITGPFVDHAPADDSNLVTRAVRLMEQATGRVCDLSFQLEKNIPAGAGLGGGSSDAALVMRVLNNHWNHPLSDETLAQLGLQCGAELPICLVGQACWVEGVGDVVTPVPFDGAYAVLVWPGEGLATQDVFDRYRALQASFGAVLEIPDINHEWLRAQRNDLTAASAALCPSILSIIQAFEVQDSCLYARMTGSGSCVFGVFRDALDAKKAAEKISAAFKNAWVKNVVIMPS